MHIDIEPLCESFGVDFWLQWELELGCICYLGQIELRLRSHTVNHIYFSSTLSAHNILLRFQHIYMTLYSDNATSCINIHLVCLNSSQPVWTKFSCKDLIVFEFLPKNTRFGLNLNRQNEIVDCF